MVGKLKELPAVDDVETYQSWTERLARLVRGGVAASALLALVVFASVLAVVGSTMRLALQRRRIEVEVLKLVGATDALRAQAVRHRGQRAGRARRGGAIALLARALPRRARAARRGARGARRRRAELSSVAGRRRAWSLLGALLGATAALASLRKLVAV